jgi:hypothetical protein
MSGVRKKLPVLLIVPLNYSLGDPFLYGMTQIAKAKYNADTNRLSATLGFPLRIPGLISDKGSPY